MSDKKNAILNEITEKATEAAVNALYVNLKSGLSNLKGTKKEIKIFNYVISININ